MKFSKFLHGVRKRIKDFLAGTEPPKQDGKAQHLSYQRFESRVARVRFGEYAQVAAMRRNIRDSVLKKVRRNTRGLPVGYALYDRLRGCDIRRLPKVLRFDALAKKWERGDHLRAQQVGALQFALDEGSKHRGLKPSKLARRVMGGKRRRSCSAMRSMVDIFERQERLGRGTERTAIPQTAQAPFSVTGQPTRQQRRAALSAQGQATMTKEYSALPRKERRKLARRTWPMLMAEQQKATA